MDELSDLAAIRSGVGAEEVEDFAGAVGVFASYGGHVEAPVCVDDSGLVMSRHEHHIEIPGDGSPVSVGVVVVSMVAVGAEIHVCEQAIHRLETEEIRQVEVLAPPRLGLFLADSVQERVPIGVIRDGVPREMFSSALGGVDVSIGESLLFEPVAVHVLNGEVESAHVACEWVVGIGLDGVGDDAPMDPVGVGGGGSCELVGSEGEGFVEAADAARRCVLRRGVGGG